MVSSFAALKKSRDKSLEKLNKEVQKLSAKTTTTREVDDRFWQPEVDKSGNGYAVIRFLPAPDKEDVPFVRIWNHGFQGPGGWYIENSLTTLGKQDPASEYNSMLWNTGDEDKRNIARKQKRRLTYIANILVIKDPANPDNEGKVFLYKFGKKIFDKINQAMNPLFDEEGRPPEHKDYNPVNAFNPFDFWGGANLQLKIRKVEGYRNYDNSLFSSPSPISEDDGEIEKIWKKQYPLSPHVAPDQFKTYEQLQARLNKVLGLEESVSREVPTETAEPDVGRSVSSVDSGDESDDDESLSYFEKLAEDTE